MLAYILSKLVTGDGDGDDGEVGDSHTERTPTPSYQQQTTMNLITSLVLPFIRLTYGLMYPAYCSFKAVKTKDVREYVNWMMYWIAFALFSVIEVFADTFVGCWFPFYYEGKIIFLLWMISSSTRGGAVMYRRYIHPALLRHEEEIDACLADFKAKASSALMKWGYRVLTSASEIVMSATFRTAEPLIDNFRRTYSMNDINRGYVPRYLGPPPGSSDLRDRFGPMHPGDIYYDRNVPAQPYGDVDMGDGSDANNVDRAAVAPGNNNEATDGVDNRRLRSSTRKRHVEMSTNPQGNLQRKKEKSTKKVVKTDRTVRAPEKNA